MEDILFSGKALALIGAAIALVLAATGSAIGIGKAGNAASGVVAERPELFVNMLILEVLPGSQVIYGFVISALILFNTGLATLTQTQGVAVMAACFVVGFAALISGIYQGGVIAAGAPAVARDASRMVSIIIFAAMVETVAIFGFLVSFLIVQEAFR